MMAAACWKEARGSGHWSQRKNSAFTEHMPVWSAAADLHTRDQVISLFSDRRDWGEAYGLVDSTAGLGAFGLVAVTSSSNSPSEPLSSSPLSLGGSIPAVAGCKTHTPTINATEERVYVLLPEVFVKPSNAARRKYLVKSRVSERNSSTIAAP